ncbi:hypothetical protein WA026_014869 [Henosepilachna vigintioctopunctata]|uniref:Uncharacterized protein n=1 Tax=Henosepilachna vigintioctopunctata TaxID=420089 RepID=A0AAW1USG6_9CUCU
MLNKNKHSFGCCPISSHINSESICTDEYTATMYKNSKIHQSHSNLETHEFKNVGKTFNEGFVVCYSYEYKNFPSKKLTGSSFELLIEVFYLKNILKFSKISHIQAEHF